MAHRIGGVTDFNGQLLDLGDGLRDHVVALAGLLVSSDCGFRGFFSIARHLLDGRGHFVHGGGDLIGFDFLAVNPCAGLLGDRREFFGSAGYLCHAIADPANQLAQARSHSLYGLL